MKDKNNNSNTASSWCPDCTKFVSSEENGIRKNLACSCGYPLLKNYDKDYKTKDPCTQGVFSFIPRYPSEPDPFLTRVLILFTRTLISKKLISFSQLNDTELKLRINTKEESELSSIEIILDILTANKIINNKEKEEIKRIIINKDDSYSYILLKQFVNLACHLRANNHIKDEDLKNIFN